MNIGDRIGTMSDLKGNNLYIYTLEGTVEEFEKYKVSFGAMYDDINLNPIFRSSEALSNGFNLEFVRLDNYELYYLSEFNKYQSDDSKMNNLTRLLRILLFDFKISEIELVKIALTNDFELELFRLHNKKNHFTMSVSSDIIGQSERNDKNIIIPKIETEEKKLGNNGEKWVINYEMEKLRNFGIVKFPIHAAAVLSENLGYDIISFDEFGNEIYIEVKTTRFDLKTPFYITSNELLVSKENMSRYYLYRVYNFDELKDFGNLKIYNGDLGQFELEPVVYKSAIQN